MVDEIVDKPPSKPGSVVLALTASTSERFPGGAKPIVEDPNGDDPASGPPRRSKGLIRRVSSQEGRPSMDQPIAAQSGDPPAPDQAEPDATDFVRFCYRRRRVGWPELYDEMCAVAGRGLYRGFSVDDLSGIGVGLTLFGMPALAAVVQRVVAEDQERRRRSAHAIRAAHGEPTEVSFPAASTVTLVPVAPVVDVEPAAAELKTEPIPRLVPLAAGA